MEASLIVANLQEIFMITGDGNVVRPEYDVLSVGSGSPYALGAALALIDTDFSAEEIAERAMHIAANACAYTNKNIIKITLGDEEPVGQLVGSQAINSADDAKAILQGDVPQV